MFLKQAIDAAGAARRSATTKPERRRGMCWRLVAGVVLATMVWGCVRRTLTIETEPQGAVVVLNDEEIGATPVSTDFTWYGDYDVALRKEGYATLHTNISIPSPWYQIPPIDFFADVLWPGRIHDQHHRSFTLQPRETPTVETVIDRAVELRGEVLSEEAPQEAIQQNP